jgi:hypothetical protein
MEAVFVISLFIIKVSKAVQGVRLNAVIRSELTFRAD